MRRTRHWMGALFASLFALLAVAGAGSVQAAERYKPFVLASRGPGDFDETLNETRSALEEAGFEIVTVFDPYAGHEYKVAGVDEARVIVFTSPAVRKVAALTEYGGFIMPLRASVTQVGDEIQVSYINPTYFAYAYRLKSDLSRTYAALAKTLGKLEEFGHKRGLTRRKLRKYHYTFGMEYFNEVYELAKYSSHEEALRNVEKHLENNQVVVRKLYRLDVPGKDETVFGVSMKAPPGGDKYMDDAFQMSVVDFQPLKRTAYLPYEVMVTGKHVVALHMRFRMALHFPDLRMMGKNSFMKLMPSPEAVRKALAAAVGGKPQ